MLIGYSGDPTRFDTASRYAAYAGTAPIEFSSGGRVTHRLSRRGNRRLNHALHVRGDHPDPLRPQPGPALLRPQACRRQDSTKQLSIEAQAQRRRLASPRRRRPPHRHRMTGGPGRDNSRNVSVAHVTGSHLTTGSSAKSRPRPGNQFGHRIDQLTGGAPTRLDTSRNCLLTAERFSLWHAAAALAVVIRSPTFGVVVRARFSGPRTRPSDGTYRRLAAGRREAHGAAPRLIA